MEAQKANPIKSLVQQKVAQSQQESTSPAVNTPSNNSSVKKVVNSNLSPFANYESFEEARKMATVLANSDLTPSPYKGNASNCLLAIELANRIDTSVIAIMQNLYVNAEGSPAWSGKFVIAAINTSGRFQTALMYNMEFDENGKPNACTAFAYDKLGNKLEGTKVTREMVEGEGWNANNKWTTMPDIMYRYRSATFFGNVYVPEVLAGYKTIEEQEDIVYSKNFSSNEMPPVEHVLTMPNEAPEVTDTQRHVAVEDTIDVIVNEPAVLKTIDPVVEAETLESSIGGDELIQVIETVESPIQEELKIEEPIEEVQQIEAPQTNFKPEDFETPANMEELEFLMIDLSLEMEIKDNGRGKSFAKAIGNIDESIARILIEKVGFMQKGNMFVLDVTEFVLRDEAEDLF